MFIVCYLYIDTEAVLKRLASLATEVSELFLFFLLFFFLFEQVCQLFTSL